MQQAPTTVRHLLLRGDFRRLLATRLSSQFGDGVFQAALAGTVLFNPQQATDPIDVAAGFAVLLLPYSLVGPFAGVWLDRWSRRQVLLVANVVRAVLVVVVAALILLGVQGPGFYVAGLLVFSVNRFVLSALSAGLPHTTDAPSLVSANALSTTAGAVAAVLGGGVAIGATALTGSGSGGYAGLALASAVPYLVASAIVSRFTRGHLGPDHLTLAATVSARDVLHGMVAGARHMLAHPPATAILSVMAVHRLMYGLLTLMTLLLYRNSFAEDTGLFPGGLAGLGQVLAAGAAGTLLAAAVTPWAVRRWGKAAWVVGLLVLGGTGQLVLGGVFRPAAIVAAVLTLGFVAQGIKICVDTTLQEAVDDDFRGRVFSVYDTLFNVTFVVALLAGAFLMPASGVSWALLIGIAAGYLLTAVAFSRWARAEARRTDDAPLALRVSLTP
ncbi:MULTISPECIES: MFS transporter [unclassified Modestobacter]|uniref:MFS transporter n=1 Tax=unclassified Modestobacter TaxID=2643866 RepID=UPI0022AB2824|nr:MULTISPECIES: MFS transporter [unclassified Modestobacter]MCZ2823006.1 MFS transporter [Modestobacter sp. VKM Ac-2981]MCZ2851252.1 MFS transporter [Modestobacter sp. VKM Ac-2982]